MSSAASTKSQPPLWICPNCGQKYVYRNHWHPCPGMVRHVEEFLADKGPKAMALWDRLIEIVAANGPFDYVVQKGRVGFMVRVRFAGVSAMSERGMTLGFWLKEQVESPRFAKVEHLNRSDWLYRLRVTQLEELDEEVAGWLAMSYRVGCQHHHT